MELIVFAISIPGLFIILSVLMVLEIAGGKKLPWRRKKSAVENRMATALGMEELFAFYYATKRNEMEQKRVEIMMREEDQDGAPPRDSVDLDAGVARIHLPPKSA
jgi:cobyrinic acid a,c-diamide synthase